MASATSLAVFSAPEMPSGPTFGFHYTTQTPPASPRHGPSTDDGEEVARGGQKEGRLLGRVFRGERGSARRWTWGGPVGRVRSCVVFFIASVEIFKITRKSFKKCC